MVKEVRIVKAPKKVPKDIKKYVRNAIKMNPEPKYADDANGSYAITSAGTVTRLSICAQGTDINQRVGNKIKLKHLEFNFNLNAVVRTANAWYNVCRLMILQDSNDDGTAPVTADILAAASPISAFQGLNMVTKKRFNVVMDKLITIDKFSSEPLTGLGNTVLYTSDSYMSSKRRYKVKQPITFSGTANTTSTKGTLWFFAIQNDSTDNPTMAYYVRMVYTDM